jgi:hypothetical protein
MTLRQIGFFFWGGATVFDWNQNCDATAIWSEQFTDRYRAKRDNTDDSYTYLKKDEPVS